MFFRESQLCFMTWQFEGNITIAQSVIHCYGKQSSWQTASTANKYSNMIILCTKKVEFQSKAQDSGPNKAVSRHSNSIETILQLNPRYSWTFHMVSWSPCFLFLCTKSAELIAFTRDGATHALDGIWMVPSHNSIKLPTTMS